MARAALFAGPFALYGLLLENGGILLGYFSELEYRVYLPPLVAPLATMAGWVGVFYLVLYVTWQVQARSAFVRRSPFAAALVAVAAALGLDLQIDPLATAVGFWRWNDLLPPGPWGVPLVNFVAWACAVFPLAYWVSRRSLAFGLGPADFAARAHRRAAWRSVPGTLACASLLFLSSMAIAEGGLHGPAYMVLRHTAVEWGLIGPDFAWTPGRTGP